MKECLISSIYPEPPIPVFIRNYDERKSSISDFRIYFSPWFKHFISIAGDIFTIKETVTKKPNEHTNKNREEKG